MAQSVNRQPGAAALKRSSFRRWQIMMLQQVHHRQIGQEWTPHWHDEWSVGVVVAGACHCQVDGKPWFLPAGTVMLIAPGTVHTGALLPHADSAAVEVLMWYLPANWPQSQGFVWPQTSSFEYLPDLAKAAESVDDLPAFITWLHQAIPQLGLQEKGQSLPELSLQARQMLTQLQQMLLSGQTSVQQIANKCGISRELLHRQIKKWTGMAPQQYLRTLQLNRARHMLLDGQSIAETADACGFADQAHFTRWFRRCFGYSPGDLLVAAQAQ
ncbi:helix-turn-helix domain-containing protein [Rheinheimera sp. SA_1]|uniref:helix-turn-helix domain-containing protein n=1 Tax=Rheinheimera sp. SA_1 TaxID=1827365 RepID=UPI0018D36440|nr:AraC family transcriptional regulator [Rheinheimera sp. SA_1]